jgi:hypothetical protein
MKKKFFLPVAIGLVIIFGCISFNEKSKNNNNVRFNNATTTIVNSHYKVNMDSILRAYKVIENKEEVVFFLNSLENYADQLNQKYLLEVNHKKALAFEKNNVAFMKTKAGAIKKLHPEWSKEDCQKLADNYLWKGMHIEMVKYVRGNPDDVNVYRSGLSNKYEYVWKKEGVSHFYTKKDGIVSDYD